MSFKGFGEIALRICTCSLISAWDSRRTQTHPSPPAPEVWSLSRLGWSCVPFLLLKNSFLEQSPGQSRPHWSVRYAQAGLDCSGNTAQAEAGTTCHWSEEEEWHSGDEPNGVMEHVHLKHMNIKSLQITLPWISFLFTNSLDFKFFPLYRSWSVGLLHQNYEHL